jgi:quaternary ammonium compound-resistance protein SugE
MWIEARTTAFSPTFDRSGRPQPQSWSFAMEWAFLVLAGLFEIAWAVGLKFSDGFSRPGASLVSIAGIAASLGLLALGLRAIPLGTAYAVWTGIGIVGTAIVGMALYGEPVTATRLVAIGCILAGIVALKLGS